MASNYPLVKLPHPFLTTYRVRPVSSDSTPAQLALTFDEQPSAGRAVPKPLHDDSLTWLDLSFQPAAAQPPSNNNSSWARARRSPQTTFRWTESSSNNSSSSSGSGAPSLGQLWNVTHAIFLAHPTHECFRLELAGAENDVVRQELLATGLAIEHPKSWRPGDEEGFRTEELVVLRSSFWQGAASPLGPRPVWVVGRGTDGPARERLDLFPAMPENHHFTVRFPEEPVYARHPIRRPKPYVGSICYSRYIPEIDEHFSLEVVDWQDDAHLKLFSKWQNDPRVAQGWNETGTLEQHREYLRKLHVDPHVLCLFGRFNESRFAYFELYWAKVT
jgi:hypothetical protein